MADTAVDTKATKEVKEVTSKVSFIRFLLTTQGNKNVRHYAS